MRRWILSAVLLVLAGCTIWLWVFDGVNLLSEWAADGQRDVQNAMAQLLRDLKAGQAGAWAGLMGLCFAYGFFHAIGPGHGKLLIGGYGAAREVPMIRLSLLAVLSSLGQAVTAVLVVYAGLMLFGMGRESLTELADSWMQAASYIMISLVGVWLALRGARSLAKQSAHIGHHVHSDGTCSCGHKHAPTAQEAAEVHGVRDALLLIGAVAIRPCTGALFLLILTWRMGIEWAGIAGTFFMALGTASVTVCVAIMAVFMRSSAFEKMGDGIAVARLSALVELVAGLIIAVVAISML